MLATRPEEFDRFTTRSAKWVGGTVVCLVGVLSVFLGLGFVVGQATPDQVLVVAFSALSSVLLATAAFPAAKQPEPGEGLDHPKALRILPLLAVGGMVWGWAVFVLLPAETKETGIVKLFDLNSPFLFIASTAMALIAAVVEEVIFRGGLQTLLTEKTPLGVPGAIVLVSIVWALGHVGAYVEQVGVKELQIFGLGVIYGYARWRFGLSAAIVLHLFNNGVTLLLLVILPSPPVEPVTTAAALLL